MHAAMAEAYEIYRLYESLRNKLLETLTDANLAFSPGGENPSLGELCVEIGETQVAYIESFRTFTQNFDYRVDPVGLADSCEGLKGWYSRLDQELKTVLDELPGEAVEGRKIDRGDNFLVSPRYQLEIYKEALLIFYGKVSVYLKALGINRPPIWVDWIG